MAARRDEEHPCVGPCLPLPSWSPLSLWLPLPLPLWPPLSDRARFGLDPGPGGRPARRLHKIDDSAYK